MPSACASVNPISNPCPMRESNTNYDRQGRFDLLVQQFLEQTIDADGAGELLAMLELDSDLGRKVLDHLAVNELLQEAARTEQVSPMTEPLRRPRFAWAPWFAAAAAVILLLAVVMRDAFSTKGEVDMPKPVPALAESTSAAVAVLGASNGAEWDATSLEPTVGAPLERGILRLKKGVVRIDFFNGARVVITGSTVLELVGQDHAICHSGKLSAEVPAITSAIASKMAGKEISL